VNALLAERTTPSGVVLQLAQGDITEEATDAIVNAANERLLHGGGVAGAIARKAGPTLAAESERWVREHGPVSHAEPAWTTAGSLPCRFVIHAVGPVWGTGEEDERLAAAVEGSLRVARRLGLRSLALPAISTGIFGFPLDRAARVILGALLRGLAEPGGLELVRVVVRDDRAASAFQRAWKELPHEEQELAAGRVPPVTTFVATWREPGEVAIRAAWKRREDGGTLIDCLEHGLAEAEWDASLLAIGRGALPNADGEVELDASIMDGATLEAGAVCSLRGILPAISVARRVLENTPHVMLAGDQARRFALSQGFEPTNLMTAENIARYEQWCRQNRPGMLHHVHAVGQHVGDTITMLALEEPGHLAAASSTSGLPFKLPGRVGDSPIVGAGIYADDEVGAAGATGWGEELWKAVASFRAVEEMRRGATPQEACDTVVRRMMRRQPKSRELACAVFAIDRQGRVGAAVTEGEFPVWTCRDGRLELTVHRAPQA